MKKALILVPAILFMAVATSWAMDDDAAVEALWKSKCATCHGVGGLGDTPMGKKLKLRDLRSPEVQKMSDSEERVVAVYDSEMYLGLVSAEDITEAMVVLSFINRSREGGAAMPRGVPVTR